MPNLADYLLANRAGGNFGTMSPGEEAAAVTPGSVLDAIAKQAVTLPKRAFEASENRRQGGSYDAGPLLEAATIGMGGGATALERGALGSGGGRMKVPDIGKYPQYAESYPGIAAPVTQIEKATGKEFLSKGTSPEVETFRKDRAAIQKDIQAGNYDPYFPEAQRYDADPSKFPTFKDTSDIQMKKPETVAKYEAIARDPAALDKLNSAFDKGMKNFQNTGNWYHMGQLADQFEAHYGPDLGPRMFKQKFADAMAATTGGADPTSNLLMAHYGNYLHEHGVPTPGASYDMPFPIGGRYVTGNMAQYDKMIRQGEGVTPENPKRYNFSGAFQGNPGAMTIDEQMSSPYMMGGKPMGMPPPGTYGHFQGAMSDLAAAKGVDPRGFQDVTWAGLKGEVTGPMMRHVNQAIERTSRLTGASPAEVVREALVKSRRPLYGAAGGAGLGDVLLQSQRQEQ